MGNSEHAQAVPATLHITQGFTHAITDDGVEAYRTVFMRVCPTQGTGGTFVLTPCDLGNAIGDLVDAASSLGGHYAERVETALRYRGARFR